MGADGERAQKVLDGTSVPSQDHLGESTGKSDPALAVVESFLTRKSSKKKAGPNGI